MVLTAEHTLLQAGMHSDILDDDDWNSNILRNTEQVALLIAAGSDALLVEANLQTREPDMATALASVVRGLIGLASLSDELDQEALAVLHGTRIDADDNTLRLSLAVDPELVVKTLDD